MLEKEILVTGGAGYVGAVLVPKLLLQGYKVKVIDLFMYQEHVFSNMENNSSLSLIKGDIRDISLLNEALEGCDTVIHLACISNDPSFDLNPELGKSINYEAFAPLVRLSIEKGIRHFIYASSSSVYGIKETDNVTEDMRLSPLTDYSKYKAICEEILMNFSSPDFCTTIVRPATVCGYSPRQRLDVIVNTLTMHAICKGEISVYGGEQKRPNIHIEDMVDAYLLLLKQSYNHINETIYNVGFENRTLMQLAQMVLDTVGKEKVNLRITPSNDRRSYHISSEKIQKELGFTPKRTVQDGIKDLMGAFAHGLLPDPLEDKKYYNILRMREINLQ